MQEPENDSQDVESSELDSRRTQMSIVQCLTVSDGSTKPEFSQTSENIVQDVEKSDMQWEGTTMPMLGSLSGNSHVGLFRTPISGGVQSATSSHGLPRPALAVRNLMEQVKTLANHELELTPLISTS